MTKLDRNLNEWVSIGLLSQEQANKIKVHEENKPENSWIISSILILGAVIVGIGMISLIASNWYQIPNAIKISVNFTILICLAIAIYKNFEVNGNITYEVLLLLFLIQCLASIGLISQIYHTGGKIRQALIFWSLITLALATTSRRILIPFLWTSTFIISLCLSILDSIFFQNIYHQNYQVLLMTLALICASLSLINNKINPISNYALSFRVWTLISGLFALAFAELQSMDFNKINDLITALSPAYLLGFYLIYEIWSNGSYKKIQKVLQISTLLFFLMPFHFPLFQIKSLIVYATFTILVLGFLCFFLASLKKRRLFQWLLIILGLRFLILYFQAIGGLATTGFGLIISGSMVIAMAMLWNKYKTHIADWAERCAE